MTQSTRRAFSKCQQCCALGALLLAVAPAAAEAQPASDAANSAAVSSSITSHDLIELRSVSLGDMSEDGRWLFVTATRPATSFGVDYNRSFGDPTYAAPTHRESWIVDTRTGERTALFNTPRVLGNAAWSPNGQTLALVAQNAREQFELLLWDRPTRRSTSVALPAGHLLTANAAVRWSDAGDRVYFTARTVNWRDKASAEFLRLTTGPVVVQSSEEPFLAWNGLQRLGQVQSVMQYIVADRRVEEVIAESIRQQWVVTGNASHVVYTEDKTKKTDYETIGGSEQRLLVRSMRGNDTAQLFASTRGLNLTWSSDNRRFAYMQNDRLMIGTVGDTARIRLAGDTAARADTTQQGRQRRARERLTPVRWVPNGSALVASNATGLWLFDVPSGQRTRIVETDTASTAPRYQVVGTSEDGAQVLLAQTSRTEWQRAVLRFTRATGRIDTLLNDSRNYGNFSTSRDGAVMVFTAAPGNRPSDIWMMNTATGATRQLTDVNPQLASKTIGGTSLLRYLDADGAAQNAVVHYPAGYVEGQRYPTVFIIYEQYFNDTWDGVANLLNANGYLVVKPSVRFDIGYPGEAWVKGVTAAANKVIELGMADSTRLGVHGTSYGGYATNLLITQTNRFKAAINISGKVDMISFYTDSPRLGIRNVHAAERSQDRLGATLWQQPQKYIAHSAVMFADRISTPLLLLTGEHDHNVPALNTREMYFALRRLDKPVAWVNYMRGGHGQPMSSREDYLDFQQRIVGWYDRYLKAERRDSTRSN